MTDPKAMPFVIESKIIKHHSLAKFLEQVEQHINAGYSILLNDIKTYPKQVAGMFFATMVKALPSESEKPDVEPEVSSPEVKVGEMSESNDAVADDPVVEQEKPAPKRRNKAQADSE